MDAGSAAEKYERGLVLRKAGLFKQAIAEYAQAVVALAYARVDYAQMGLCVKAT